MAEAVKLLKTTKPAATRAVTGLIEAEVLVETTGRRRDRAFSDAGCPDILRAEMEPF